MLIVTNAGKVLRIRWTWMPCWLALNNSVQYELGILLKEASLLNGMTHEPEDMYAMHLWLIKQIVKRYPEFQGLDTYLRALEQVDTAQR